MRGWPAWLEPRTTGFVLALHVQPGARRTSVIGPHGDRLKVAVAAPPIEGRANSALIDFVAERLDLPKSRVSVVAGANSREKRVAVETELPAETIIAALAPPQGR